MTYTPTAKELQELWFAKETSAFFATLEIWLISLVYDSERNHIEVGNYHNKAYPQSKQDIETLIRLFTQP